MQMLKPLLWTAGLLALVIGLIWIGQGSGNFPYPRSSFMIDQRPWITLGTVLAAFGLLLILIARRLRR